MSKRNLLLFALELCCLTVVAQINREQKGQHNIIRVDSILDTQNKTRVDTCYITRPSTHWTLKVRTRGYGNFVSMRGDSPSIGTFRTKINTPLKTTLGISANYRGLSVALAVSPTDIFATNSSRNINLAYYNNRFGADFSFSSTGNLTTNIIIGDNMHELNLTDSHLKQLSASVYYVFNGKKFSYPAAFTHSWIQRRSAGSYLVSTGFYKSRFVSSMDDMTDYMSREKRFTMNHVSIGVGYAYNFVPNEHWLLHLSLVPNAIVWHDYRYTLTSDPNTQQPVEKKIPYKSPGFGGTGRFGATYSWKNYFTGFSSVVQSSNVGIGNQDMSAGNTWMRVEVFWGLRL